MRPVAALTPVVEVIERRLGISCSGVRAGVVAEIVRHHMQLAGIVEPVAFAARLETDVATRDQLAESLRVPETYLMREPMQLRLLRDRILPSLRDGRDGDRPLRLWSAGCASGEEAYSLAIVLHQRGLAGAADLLATDRSDTALAEAARGVYRSWSFRGFDEATHGSYFRPSEDGAGREVVPQLRRGITFRRHDLVTDPYPQGLDLIVCRNVLLYLTPRHGAAVLERLASALAPGGWLLLGSADPHHTAADLLEQVRTPAGSLYRRPARPRRPAARPVAPETSTTDVTVRDTDVEAIPDRLDDCDHLLAERPLDAALHRTHATLLLEAGQPEGALRAATKALFLAPELAAAHLVSGRAHLALGDPLRASRAFGRARELLAAADPDAPIPGSTVSAGRLLTVTTWWEQRAEAWTA